MISSFLPNVDQHSEVIILGSMPGVESLRQQQYYAHPYNTFWKILGELCGFSAELPYEDRLQQLLEHRIALWDSAFSCQRDGSLDSAIRAVQINNFEEFFQQYPAIKTVCFNGQAAGKLFIKHSKTMNLPPLTFIQLPSTSPAHASMKFSDKLAAWQQIPH
ncbi:MAG: DNA-deoxyinosine glycosylase [Victivallaceae bacterium]|nr:DNA-deoxyinosine glycosylase [Victivallaceae bacterium]